MIMFLRSPNSTCNPSADPTGNLPSYMSGSYALARVRSRFCAMVPAPHPQLRVLSIGNEGLLLWVRSLILKQSGYDVCSLSLSHNSWSESHFDVVVFCSSVEIESAKAIVRTMKAMHPAVRTIRLSSSTYDDGSFDAVVDAISGPGPLLAELNRISATLIPRSADRSDGTAIHPSQQLSDSNSQERYSSGPFHSTKSSLCG